MSFSWMCIPVKSLLNYFPYLLYFSICSFVRVLALWMPFNFFYCQIRHVLTPKLSCISCIFIHETNPFSFLSTLNVLIQFLTYVSAMMRNIFVLIKKNSLCISVVLSNCLTDSNSFTFLNQFIFLSITSLTNHTGENKA